MEKLRGNEILNIQGTWVYADDLTPCYKDYAKRPCGHCGTAWTPEGHDGCLGTLPAVMNACCGHGGENEPYLQFWDKSDVRGKEASIIIGAMKRGGY